MYAKFLFYSTKKGIYMKEFLYLFLSFVKNNKGQGLVEYSLILVLIAVVVILALRMLGGDVNNTYQNIDSAIVIAR